MSTSSKDGYQTIVWNGKTYIPYCVIPNDKRGKQIGIVNSDENDQIFKFTDYSEDEWIISFYYSGEMDNSILYKEVNVKKIPEGLKSDYKWNK